MDITTRKYGQVTVIKLKGTFRLGQAVDEFKAQSEHLLTDGSVRLALNLADVPMMDSSAIGVIVRLMTSCKSRGGGLKLVSPSKLVLQTLTMVGLMNIFETYEDETRAVESFGGAAS